MRKITMKVLTAYCGTLVTIKKILHIYIFIYLIRKIIYRALKISIGAIIIKIVAQLGVFLTATPSRDVYLVAIDPCYSRRSEDRARDGSNARFVRPGAA